jgi:uncharacterized protein with PQ loop repeat
MARQARVTQSGVIEIVGFLAASLILVASIPQVLALLRHGAEGVSLGSWSLLLATSLVWAAVGVRIESPSTVVGNVAGMFAFSLVVALLVRSATGRWWPAGGIAPAGLAVFAVAMFAPLAVTSVVGVLFGLTLGVPQLRESFVMWRNSAHSEVALGAWRLLFAGQVLWLVYGLATRELAIVVVNIGAACASAAILMLETRARAAALSAVQPGPAHVAVGAPAA